MVLVSGTAEFGVNANTLLKDGIRIPCSRRYRQALRSERIAFAAASV